MNSPRLGFLLLVSALTACDPAATTSLRVRPLGEASAPSSKQTDYSLSRIRIVLESFGFERKSYPPDAGQKIMAECGVTDYWLKSNRDVTGSFGTYARICISDGAIRLSLSDWGRFSLSEPTKELRGRVAQSLRESLSGMEVTVE